MDQPTDKTKPSNRAIKYLIIVTAFLPVVAVLCLLYLKNQPCRNGFGLPLKTGANESGQYEFNIQYLDLLSTKACIVSKDAGEDNLFPESSKRLIIGYFDKLGIMHKYPARIGGKDFDGREFDISVCNGSVCKMTNIKEAYEQLEEGNVLDLLIVYKDQAPWKGSDQNKENLSELERLNEALQQGWKYPKPGDGFVIQIWQIDL
jgi:hypothetical protein